MSLESDSIPASSTGQETSLPPRNCGIERDKKIPEEYRLAIAKATVFPSCASPPRTIAILRLTYSQVREIALDMQTNYNGPADTALRWQSSALMALQEAAEAFLVHLFEDACVLKFFCFPIVALTKL